jgi:hypothetical protein
MRATAVGPDLGKVIARIEQPAQPNYPRPAAVDGETTEDQADVDDDGVDDGPGAQDGAGADAEGLVLGAPA